MRASVYLWLDMDTYVFDCICTHVTTYVYMTTMKNPSKYLAKTSNIRNR